MSDQSKPGVRTVQTHGSDLAVEDGVLTASSRAVAVEVPITIGIAEVGTYTTMGTPADARALAVGLMFTEGIIGSVSDIAVLGQCLEDGNTIRVQLANPKEMPGGEVMRVAFSSCGLCGTETLEERLNALPVVGDTLRLAPAVFHCVLDTRMRARQELYSETHGAHAAAIFDDRGAISALAEDVGRHNALDKAIGLCLLSGIDPGGRAAALSGRVSLEMLMKCARAGIELIAAVSAPTSLAIDAAERAGITLCASIRNGRATVFTHPHRVTTSSVAL